MPFAQDSPKRTATRILIVCLPELEPGTRRLLGSACHADWERDQMVLLRPVTPNLQRDKQALSNLIDSLAPAASPIFVWVQSQIELEPRMTGAPSARSLRPPIRRFPSHIVLKKELTEVVATLQLDWKSHVLSLLTSGWVHGTTPLNRDRVDLWMDQFTRLGENNRWIGESLLRDLGLLATRPPEALSRPDPFASRAL